jgi:subtilase family serine protease
LLAVRAIAKGATIVVVVFSLSSCSSAPGSLNNQTTPSPSSASCAASDAPNPCYTALQLEEAYNLHPLYSKGLNGAGITVVVLAQSVSPTLVHDLAVFDGSFHLPTPSIRVVSSTGTLPKFDAASSSDVGGASEVTLDTEAVHTIAPGAKIVVLVAPLGADPASVSSEVASVHYAAQHHLGEVITNSLGNIGEAALGAPTINALHQDFEYAAARNISVIDASGDFGASSRQTLVGPAGPGCCFTERMRGYPASDPLVTAVGATLSTSTRGAIASAQTPWPTTRK